jgi:plastocyanin
MNWMHALRRTGQLVLLTLPLLAASACGSNNNDGGGPNGSELSVAKAAPSGDAQTDIVGHQLANPLRIVVTRAGVPEPGATVAWQTSATAALLTPATGVTGADGTAATVLKLGTAAGAQTVQASVAGAGSVSFVATAVHDAPSKLRLLTSGPVTGLVNTTLAQPLQAKAEDQFGNAVAGVSVHWQVAAGTATLSPATSTTNAQGVASTALTFGNTVGAIQIQAQSQGLTGSPAVLAATATAAPAFVTVQLLSSGGNRFSPTALTIARGTTVRFDWVGGFHDVTANGSPSFQSSGAPIAAPHTYDVTFTTAGTFNYFCSIHGSPGAGMHGAIVVQ